MQMTNDEPQVIQESTPGGDNGAAPPELPKTQAEFFTRAAEKVRSKFPHAPGVYLFQDQAGRVLYIGKAADLRARVGSYFLAAAAADQRTAHLVREAYDVDFVEAESEVDAVLMEARLVKDIQPKYNRELRDDKSFPYLQITTHEDYPARRGDPRAPYQRGQIVWSVRQRGQPARCGAGDAKGVQVPQLFAGY